MERLLCLGALVALGFLVALTVPMWQEYSRSHSAGRVPGPEGNAASSPASAASEDKRPVQRSIRAKLRLQADGGDCWLLVRRDNESGRVLFTGVLARGESLSVAGTAFWVRMGASENLSGRFAGRPVTGLPNGAATISIQDGAVSVVEFG